MKLLKKILKVIMYIVLWVLAVFALWYFLRFPSLDRNWNDDQKVLAEITIDNQIVTVKNARNFRYRTTADYDKAYYDAVYDASKLARAWYIIEPFGDRDGPAHTMLSFDFDDGQTVSVSAEIRKEVGESFDAVKWLLRQYELVYMVGDERDLIRLRSDYRRDEVIMLPLKMSEEWLQRFFLSVMNRAKKLATKPEWYNTITNTCTTAIQYHANEILPDDKKIPWSKQILLPKYSDTIAYDMGYIDTALSIEEARKYYRINERSLTANEEEYSKSIRPEIK